MEKINGFKAAVTGVLAALTALWGWAGWLAVGWIGMMVLDYLTGSAAALKTGEWSSKVAREGIWHKAGAVAVVTACGALDLIIGQVVNHLDGLALPFTYRVILCPIVMVWYVLTETGSIIENAGLLGVTIPPWLRKLLAAFRDKLDEDMDDKGEG